MAEIGGMLAASVLKMAAGKMAKAAGDRVMLQWRFGEDLEDIEDTVESIQAVLEDAEGQSIQNASVRLWLKRLTRASNDISDMFDEFEVNPTKKSSLRKLKVLNPCLKLAPEVGMSSKMKKIREKLEKISNHHHKFSFMAGISSNVHHVIDERATSSENDILFGTEGVMKLLTRPGISSDVIIVPIYGIGGMGKTTLAQLLFNDAHVQDYKKEWIYVGQTFDLEKIKYSVNQLRIREQEQDAGPSAPKNILIVLDDLWVDGDSELTDLKDFLKMVGSGCKLHAIVTTRFAGIGEKIKENEAHKIKPLSPSMCWTIIKQIVGFEDRAEAEKEKLREIGISIAEKCEGVALAARAIGYLLKSRDYNGWVSVQRSGFWNASKSGSSPYDNVLASLKLSYSNMPAFLRLCFAYCAIFPKGHYMAKHDLIYQWAALGFINWSDEISIWQNGENCIKQLLDMSFFQHSKSPSIIDFYAHIKKDVQWFTMHDLVHDLARLIMKDEVLDATAKCNNIRGRNYRYVFLPDCSKPLRSFVTYPDKIRALRFLGGGLCPAKTYSGMIRALYFLGSDSPVGFSTATYLRVLDLAECSLDKLPSSIGNLRLLRYLNAPRIKDRVIPNCITKLSKLIFLSLRESRELEALPESIGEMKALMYLNLSACENIIKLPTSFGKLESLVHLDLSLCCRTNGTPEALCRLTKLQYLNLSQDAFSGENQTLRVVPEVIRKLTELRYLNVSGFMRLISPEEFDHLLGNISTLSNLEHLDLSRNDFETIPDSICGLRKLHTLDLTSCGLRTLPGNISLMDSLKFLIVDGCSSLDMSTLPASKSLIPLPNFVVHAFEDEQSSNLVLLKHADPRELKISRLENVKSVQEARRIELRGKQSLVRLEFDWTVGSKRFVEDMEVLGELILPSSLRNFELRGYNSVSFPQTWLKGIAIYLTNLSRVTLKGLPQCTSLPPLGQLPNLEKLHLESMPSLMKIDRGLCGDTMKAFAKLEELTISDMEKLKEWNTTYSCDEGVTDEEFMFPNLEQLTISKCPELRVGPCPPRVKRTWMIRESDSVLLELAESAPPRTACSTPSALVYELFVKSSKLPMRQWKLLHHLPGLDKLSIENCHDLSRSPEISRTLVSVRSLWLDSWSSDLELPLLLGDLTSLQSLVLRNGSTLEELPPLLGDLTSLQSLVLSNCWRIKALPERLGDCVSLKRLGLDTCTSIKSLPESIKQLTNLETLKIWFCPELSAWCNLEENKTKIAHIKEIDDWGFFDYYNDTTFKGFK